MGDGIKDKEAPAAGTVTEETPAQADESSAPGPGDAKLNDPPVRTNRPDVPIADTLAAGAGQHEGRELDHVVKLEDGTEVAVDENGLDADGRFIGAPKKSSSSSSSSTSTSDSSKS